MGGYYNKLVAKVKADSKMNMSLEDHINIKTAAYNLAAQIWNHTFYWNSLNPKAGDENKPTGDIAKAIEKDFGSFEKFKELFSKAAGHFGSGWAWLVQDTESGKLSVVDTADAGNPMTKTCVPILTCDVWEHAYYIDFRNSRGEYIKTWWNLVNWEFANKNLNSKMS